jgi:hypothetical protein
MSTATTLAAQPTSALRTTARAPSLYPAHRMGGVHRLVVRDPDDKRAKEW